MEGEAIARQ